MEYFLRERSKGNSEMDVESGVLKRIWCQRLVEHV